MFDFAIVALSPGKQIPNMGKYMRKGKGVGKMAVREVSQGSLGVRTRARALALEKDSKLSHTSSESESLMQPHQSECNESRDTYMELRSRRLEKVARCSIGREEDVTQAARAIQRPLRECSMPSEFSNSDVSGGESSRLRLPNTSRSRHGLCRLASTVGSDASHTRRAQVSLQSSLKGSVSTGVIPRRVTPTASGQSRSNSVSIPQRRPGILTRNQRQELANATSQEGLGADTDIGFPRGAGTSRNERNIEVEAFFGESPMIAGPSKDSRGSHEGGSRRRTRECTPDSYIRDVETPGSTSRTRRSGLVHGRSLSAPPFGRANNAPSPSEIEAFFEGAEERERRRFIERYNFDPMNERPLRGRYEWFSM